MNQTKTGLFVSATSFRSWQTVKCIYQRFSLFLNLPISTEVSLFLNWESLTAPGSTPRRPVIKAVSSGWDEPPKTLVFLTDHFRTEIRKLERCILLAMGRATPRTKYFALDQKEGEPTTTKRELRALLFSVCSDTLWGSKGGRVGSGVGC